MAIYGYCVAPPDHRPPAGLRGIDDVAVLMRVVAGLGVWYSEIERPEPTVTNVEAHNRVVEAAVTLTVTPVPLRFGQWADDVDSYCATLLERALWYAERLQHFAGALEFGIRVVAPERVARARDVHVPAAATGREYMNLLRTRAATAQETRAVQERVRAAINQDLGLFVREERAEEAQTPHAIVTLAHLVARPDFGAYLEFAQALRSRFPELRFLVSGPWAPYSFAT